MDKLNRVKKFFTPNQVEWFLRFKGETAQMTDQQRNEYLNSWGGTMFVDRWKQMTDCYNDVQPTQEHINKVVDGALERLGY